MRLVTWNVNGLRACLGKGFLDFFQRVDADVVCLQETKLQPDQIALELPGYRLFWNSAEKKGYSGTAVFTRVEPLSVTCGIGLDAHDHEGRVITAEFDGFFLVCCYTPTPRTSWPASTTGCSGRTTSGPTSWSWTKRSRWCCAAISTWPMRRST